MPSTTAGSSPEPCLAEITLRTFLLDGERFAGEEAAGLDALAAAPARTRVLGVTRQGPAEVERSNQLLHALTGGGPGLLPGKPVLMLRNDHGRELWSGEPGIATRAERGSGIAERLAGARGAP